MTQQTLAEKVGVSRQTIIAIESGRYSPSLEVALKLAQIFKRPVEDLFWLPDS
ncbi:MAG: helix-turn-helix transcriptional regulator [Wenzhouxiangella sp.]|jgi:putative transcriptional regulator|nr:helix-turn-helix transcriptional regulator [Wenzhouxiangella sp.]